MVVSRNIVSDLDKAFFLNAFEDYLHYFTALFGMSFHDLVFLIRELARFVQDFVADGYFSEIVSRRGTDYVERHLVAYRDLALTLYLVHYNMYDITGALYVTTCIIVSVFNHVRQTKNDFLLDVSDVVGRLFDLPVHPLIVVRDDVIGSLFFCRVS